MGEIVNLRRARKAQARKLAEETAAQNRAKSGETKKSRRLRAADQAQQQRSLDQKRLDKGTP